MRLRTFTAADMPTAMEMVREELGDDAIILSSGAGKGRQVSVTAAADPDRLTPRTKDGGSPKSVDTQAMDMRFELQTILRYHNLPEMFVARTLQKANDADLRAAAALHKISGNRDDKHLHRLALEKAMNTAFGCEPIAFDAPDLRIMLVGAPGAGKTLTIAKMAARVAMDKKPLTVVTTDNKRAGGIEQLKAFTDILGLELEVATSRTELSEIMKKAHPRMLVDTAGCNPYDENEFKELESLATIGGIEPVLVMPAGGDSQEAIDMAETFAALPLQRLLVTRADTTRRFGAIMAAAAAHSLAFSNASHSASIIDPLHPVDASLLAQLLLKYRV